MEPITLSQEFKERLKNYIETRYKPTDKEATRSHKIIARLLNEIIDFSPIDYLSEEYDKEGKKPDFILYHGERKDFYIIEAKWQMAIDDHLEKLDRYLKSSSITDGCLTDGIQWVMYEKTGGKIKQVKTLNIAYPQEIVNYIFSTIRD